MWNDGKGAKPPQPNLILGIEQKKLTETFLKEQHKGLL